MCESKAHCVPLPFSFSILCQHLPFYLQQKFPLSVILSASTVISATDLSHSNTWMHQMCTPSAGILSVYKCHFMYVRIGLYVCMYVSKCGNTIKQTPVVSADTLLASVRKTIDTFKIVTYMPVCVCMCVCVLCVFMYMLNSHWQRATLGNELALWTRKTNQKVLKVFVNVYQQNNYLKQKMHNQQTLFHWMQRSEAWEISQVKYT